MVRRLILGKNNHLSYYSLVLNPRYENLGGHRFLSNSSCSHFTSKLVCQFTEYLNISRVVTLDKTNGTLMELYLLYTGVPDQNISFHLKLEHFLV